MCADTLFSAAGTGRVARFELVPLEELGRPRMDVLCNMSGIFRDSFQNVVELLDDLFQARRAQGGTAAVIPPDIGLNPNLYLAPYPCRLTPSSYSFTALLQQWVFSMCSMNCC